MRCNKSFRPRLRARGDASCTGRPILAALTLAAFSAVFPANYAQASILGPHFRPLAAIARPFGHAKPEAHPGYLGVSTLNIDADQAQQLHLKDTRGVLILTIDRDAPAATAGLRAHDVILEFDGHHVDDTEQLRHRLSEAKAGSTVKLRIMRDGVQRNLSVELGDEDEIARQAWEQHVGPTVAAQADAQPSVAPPQTSPIGPSSAPSRDHTPGSSFLGVFSINALYTGAELDPLSTQLAYFFGVHDGAGLLVRTVDQNSPAAVAGLQAGDVILRVNSQPVVSRVDWIKQLRANRGRPMQLGIMRNHHEQLLTMVSGPPKK
jgi:S1-C subfamily serine protease